MCTVFLPAEDRVVNIMCDHLDPVRPQRGDQFKVCFKNFFVNTSNVIIFYLTTYIMFTTLLGYHRRGT